MRRWAVAGLLALPFAGCADPSEGGLPQGRYTFGPGGYVCTAVVLDLHADGSATMTEAGIDDAPVQPVAVERRDAEYFVTPEDDAAELEALDATRAILRRTSCTEFAATLETESGDVDLPAAAAEPCFEYFEAPENGDEWDPCRMRLCNHAPC